MDTTYLQGEKHLPACLLKSSNQTQWKGSFFIYLYVVLFLTPYVITTCVYRFLNCNIAKLTELKLAGVLINKPN